MTLGRRRAQRRLRRAGLARGGRPRLDEAALVREHDGLDSTVRCECGFEATAVDELQLAWEIKCHARTEHGVEFSFEDAPAVVLRTHLAGLDPEAL